MEKGDRQFVLDTLEAAEERFDRKYELEAKGYDLDALAKYIEEIFGMEPGDIYSPGKYMRFSRLLAALACFFFFWILGLS